MNIIVILFSNLKTITLRNKNSEFSYNSGYDIMNLYRFSFFCVVENDDMFDVKL